MQRHSEKYLKGAMVLMAVVVLLPSVALLWFVSKTIENEKYALREKLAEQYTKIVQEKQQEVMVRVERQIEQGKEEIAKAEGSDAEDSAAEAVEMEVIGQMVDEHLGEVRRLRAAKRYNVAVEKLEKILDDRPDPAVELVARYFLVELNSTASELFNRVSTEKLMQQFSESAVAFAKKNRDFSEMLYEKAGPIYAVQTIRDEVNDSLVYAWIFDKQERLFDNDAIKADENFLVFLDLDAPLKRYVIGIRFHEGVFAESAERQKFFYFWLVAIIIGLMLLVMFALVTMIARWNRLHRLRNDFLATVSHELKTPLTSIRLLVDTLKDKVVDDEVARAEYLEIIASQNQRLSHLIDNFLSYSRMERNKRQFHFEEVSPSEIVLESVRATRAAFDGQCELQIEIADDLPAVFADKEVMVTAIVNLLENALKYTDEEKVICVRLFQENGEVCFAVEDNGCGMSDRERKKIFQKFYRADNRLSRQAEGVGLGLSIVRFIVEAHRGKIEVRSEVERGSVFTIRLPATSI